MEPKVLFILKRRQDFNPDKHQAKSLSTGLFNSASFMDEMLVNCGIESQLEVAIDNNCIDRLVTKHRPTHVIIEALWVVPSKFAVLTKLHPSVKWIIRLHSEMPFMAGEGIAMDWIGDYMTYPQLYIGVNAPRMLEEIRTYIQIKKSWSSKEVSQRIVYLPNYYPQIYQKKEFDRSKDHVDISCFGAVRPLKNHLLQAFAALDFANSINKKLRFHINAGRVEQKGESVMNNLRSLFEQLADTGHQLIAHEWMQRDNFLQVCQTVDIGMQVSFSETFNIVAADLVTQGVPVVGSDEIPWSSRFFRASAQHSKNMSSVLLRTYLHPQLNVRHHQKLLNSYCNRTKKIWINYFTDNNNAN
jgi:hypothetical protein